MPGNRNESGRHIAGLDRPIVAAQRIERAHVLAAHFRNAMLENMQGHVVVPEIFISAVICAFHAAKSHSFRTPRLSFKRSPGRLAAKAGQNRRGIVPFARHKKIALRKGTPFLAIMRSSHLML